MPPFISKIATFARALFDVGRQLQTHQDAIEELRAENRRLAEISRRLYYEVQRLRDDNANLRAAETRERENLALRLQNEQLRFERDLERRLPPARSSDES